MKNFGNDLAKWIGLVKGPQVKPIWALVNSVTSVTHGDAFTSKREATRHANKLNRFIKRDSPGSRERYHIASVHPELAQGLTINPYARH